MDTKKYFSKQASILQSKEDATYAEEQLMREILNDQGGGFGGDVTKVGNIEVESIYIEDDGSLKCHINQRGYEFDVDWDFFSLSEQVEIVNDVLDILVQLSK